MNGLLKMYNEKLRKSKIIYIYIYKNYNIFFALIINNIIIFKIII